jgi:hypothetical protein
MPEAYLALITPLTGAHPAQPLPVPPVYPSHGLPGGGYPDQGLPGEGHPDGRPDQGLPVPPGTIYPPLPPELPPSLAGQTVVAVKRPGQDWVVKSYPPGPAHPIAPTPPTPAPKPA